jgi:hypothetical protein
MDLGTHFALGMHHIQRQNPSLHQHRGEQGFERTNPILLLLNIALPQDRSDKLTQFLVI